MNRDETVKILSVLKGAYPQAYRGMTREDAESTIGLWSEMFTEPYPVVAAATKAFICTDSKGFPPAIGQIKDKIRLLTQKQEMTEIEAWGYVQKALGNSLYNSQEEFEKLPPAVKRLVGTHNQLREWAMMDTETVQSVVASNFQRSYKARAKSEKEYLALPADVRKLVEGLTEGMQMPALEDPERKAVE